MTDDREFQLLGDIARLLRKYGAETFENLARRLSSPDFAGHLATLLSRSADTARASRNAGPHGAQQKHGQKTIHSTLASLAQTEPEKSELLLKFYDDLLAKAVLPSLRDIQAFVSDSGLPPVKASSRDKAVVPLVKSLLPQRFEELVSLLSRIKRVSASDDRSLEGWSNIILNRTRRTKTDQ